VVGAEPVEGVGERARNSASVEHKVGDPFCANHDTRRCVSTDSICDLRGVRKVSLEEQDTSDMRERHGCSAYCPSIALQLIREVMSIRCKMSMQDPKLEKGALFHPLHPL
jgi:hypothetical protein